MKTLGDAIRQLMEGKAITGVQLAGDTGLTPASISRILTGSSRPRQVTLSRLMKRLCETREEEQSILRAYANILDGVPEELIVEDDQSRREEVARCERFLEIKTQSISFKNSVARELAKAGIEAKQDYCEGLISTDFLIEREGKRIALECKFNVHRDIEKTRITSEIIRDRLRCANVMIVIPFSDSSTSNCLSHMVSIVASVDLVRTIKQAFNCDHKLTFEE